MFTSSWTGRSELSIIRNGDDLYFLHDWSVFTCSPNVLREAMAISVFGHRFTFHNIFYILEVTMIFNTFLYYKNASLDNIFTAKKFRYLPESPRWLLATNRLEEAFNTLQLLAETNGKDIPTFFTENIRRRINEKKCVDSSSATKKVPNVSMLLKTPNMRTKTLLITLNW